MFHVSDHTTTMASYYVRYALFSMASAAHAAKYAVYVAAFITKVVTDQSSLTSLVRLQILHPLDLFILEPLPSFRRDGEEGR